jgi:hypothetical protein
MKFLPLLHMWPQPYFPIHLLNVSHTPLHAITAFSQDTLPTFVQSTQSRISNIVRARSKLTLPKPNLQHSTLLPDTTFP